MIDLFPVSSLDSKTNATLEQPLPTFSGPYFLVGLILLVHSLIGLMGWSEKITPPLMVATIALNFCIFFVAKRFLSGFRRWLDEMSVENIILLHAIRAPIGTAFLLFASHNMLPQLFAFRAGWGDILAGALALVVVSIGNLSSKKKLRWWLYILWGAFGILDLILAVGTGFSIFARDPESMIWMARLPFFLVPGFLVPWLMALHFEALRKLFSGTHWNG